MAITISGQNNNDKILASDGVLDSISGFNVVGVMTASQFDVTGKTTTNHISIGNNIHLGNAGIITATTLIGNVTGNINHESNLLLQISGSEKFRVGNGGQFGIAGANYGTAGQVFTSGGSGSAPTWSTINSDKITEGNTEAEVVDTGSDGHFKVTTEGSERLRVTADGNLTVGAAVTISPVGNINATGIVTATSFSGSGANLTSLPSQVSIANNADNRVITGGSGVNLNGEANLTFDGDDLLIRSSTDGRRISFATDGTSHYMKYDNTLSGIILNGYGGIAFETNGTNERLRIDSSGRVGINRTPALASSKLEVGGADNYPLINVEASGATAGFGIGASALRFYYGTTEHLNLNSSGHLTLQTTDAKIQLKDGNNYIQFVNADKNFKFMNAWGAGEFTFHVNGGERVRINADGDLLKGSTGLNNSSVAGQAIQISGTTRPTLILRGNSSGSNVGEIQFADNSGTDSDPGTRAGMIQYNHHGGNFMAFHVNNDSVPKFRINSWGGLSAVNSQYSGNDKSHAYYFSFHKSGTYNTFTVDIGFNSPGGYNLEMMMGGYGNRRMHNTQQGYVYDGAHYGSSGAIDSGNGPQRSWSTVSQYGSYGTKMRFQFTSMSSTHTVVEMRLTYGPAGGTSEADITNVSWS